VPTIDITPLVFGYMLYLARVSTMILAVPAFGTGGAVRYAKTGLAAFVAFLLLRANGIPKAAFATNGVLVLALLGEIGIGLAIGWAVRLALSALAVGGHIVGQEMGLNMASMVDPITGRQSPVVASMFELLGVVLFFAFGLHREMFLLLRASYRTIPAGQLKVQAVPWSRWAADGLSRFFEAGVRMARRSSSCCSS
jgi:flagellar biosynthetic protein FliR